jgi:hypothetical protein
MENVESLEILHLMDLSTTNGVFFTEKICLKSSNDMIVNNSHLEYCFEPIIDQDHNLLNLEEEIRLALTANLSNLSNQKILSLSYLPAIQETSSSDSSALSEKTLDPFRHIIHTMKRKILIFTNENHFQQLQHSLQSLDETATSLS